MYLCMYACIMIDLYSYSRANTGGSLSNTGRYIVYKYVCVRTCTCVRVCAYVYVCTCVCVRAYFLSVAFHRVDGLIGFRFPYKETG